MPSLSEAEEEPGETTSVISTQQIQPSQNVYLIPNINSGNAQRRLRIRKKSTFWWNSREKLLAAKERRYYLKSNEESRMASTGLTVSLFLLAAVCGTHFIRKSTPDHLYFKIEKSFSTSNIQQSFNHRSLPSYFHSPQFTPQQADTRKKVSHLVDAQFQRFFEHFEEIPSTFTSPYLNDLTIFGLLGGRQHLHVNVLLAENRRRTVQRQRSPTPIPTPSPSPRFVQRQRNTSSAPPDSIRSWTGLSTSPSLTQPSTSDFETNFNQSNEPTLMDYDAIDAYWRWDIDQEKGENGLSPQHNFDYSEELQNPHYGYPDNYRYFEPSDLLFERDIHLLTEKSLLPDEQINFIENNLNKSEEDFLANFSRTLSFDGIIENKNENTKWNDLLQLPTSSLFSTSIDQEGKSSFISSPSNVQNDFAGETELFNIPVSSPSFEETENDQKFNQNNLNEREIACSSSHESFSSLMDIRQPILFNDVSLARCSSSIASSIVGNDQELENLEKEQSLLNNQNNIQKQFNKEELNKIEKEEEEDTETEMILSALFPQFFSSSPLNNNNNNGIETLQQQQLSNSPINCDIINKTEIEAVLNDLATAELILLNNTQTLIQNELLLQQQQQSTSILPFSPITTTTLPPLSPIIGGPISPIFDHFNQTLNMNNSPQSNSFNFSGPLSLCNNSQNIINCCSPTSSIINNSNNFTEKEFLSETFLSNEILFNSNPFTFRYEQKLVPKNCENFLHRKNPTITKNNEGTMLKTKSKRGRRSKDNSLVNQYDLPYSAEHLTAMTYRDYSSLMQNIHLTNDQKALIKKIRRRGRNKLAARKCREKRLINEKCEGKGSNEFIGEDEEWDEDVEVVDIDDDLIKKGEYDDDNFIEQVLSEEKPNSDQFSRFPTTSLYAANINQLNKNILNDNRNSPSRHHSHKKQQQKQHSSNQFAIRVEI